MKQTFYLLFLTTCTFAQEWTTLDIGQCPTNMSYDLVIGDLRNEGANRLYVTTANGGLYEWNYGGNAWNRTSTITNDVNGLSHMTIGKGRNDGINRIYWSEFKKDVGRLREATWNGTGWDINLIHTGLHSLGIDIGDGRNDGIQRLYITSIGGMYEFSHLNGQWSMVKITDVGHEGVPDIGEGRNDGVKRVYSAASTGYESTFAQGFSNDLMDRDKIWPDALQIAPGRNDGINRIYVNNTAMDAGRFEYTWNGATWDVEIVEGNIPQRGDIHLAQLKADGKYRVYINWSASFRTNSGPLKEYEWDGTKWKDNGVILDAASGATAMIASGDGRNDKINRMYAPHWANGGIYEITNVDPYNLNTTAVSEPGENLFALSPNPSSNTALIIRMNNHYEKGEITINSLDGQLVAQFAISGSQYTVNTNDWEKGMYIINLIVGEKLMNSQKWIKL